MTGAASVSSAHSPLRLVALALALALGTPTVQATPLIGERVHLAARGLDGGSIGLGTANGRRTLLLLWAPESLASRKSLGEIQRFAASPAAATVVLMTLSMGGDAAGLREFMAERQVSFPVALRGEDNLGAVADEQLPVALLIDAEGRLLKKRSGLINLKALLDLVAPAAH